MVASGVMNLLPWGGPTARAASAFALDVNMPYLAVVTGMLSVPFTFFIANDAFYVGVLLLVTLVTLVVPLSGR